MTRAEHLAWAKERALEYVNAGETKNAVASMISDLGKHEAWQDEHGARFLSTMFMAATFDLEYPDAIRRWVNGFN